MGGVVGRSARGKPYELKVAPGASDGAADEDRPASSPSTSANPRSPTVAELKGRLAELGVAVPAHAVEKAELIAAVNRGEVQQQQRQSQGTRSPSDTQRLLAASMSDIGSPKSASSVAIPPSPGTLSASQKQRTVGELKARLKELGFKVPTSIVEKSELLDLVEEAERQAEACRRSSTSPKAPETATISFQLRTRIGDLGDTVASSTDNEAELIALLRKAEETQPPTIQQAVSGDCTMMCTLRPMGVSHIEVAATVGSAAGATMSMEDTSPTGADNVIEGSTFKWARGECIGHGASGTVFKAMNHTTGKLMAVKEVHMDLKRKADARFKEALENEIRLMQTLRHPNIVAYYGCDWLDSRIYMYLEWMAGGSIARVLDQYGPFEEVLIANYARQLLNGLEYLHTRNPYVVHRDIKGANVLLGVDCTVKLADFGCSKREEETRSVTLGGSIPWMAPEVIAHARYGRAGDIWSFGCLLIEMASAQTPWGRFDNLMAAMIRIGMSSDMPPMPSTLSKPFRAFVKCCLNRDPNRRLSASELLNERFLSSGDGVDDVLAEGEALLERDEDGRPATIPEEETLPSGWEKHFDPTYSEWYYWHRPTGRSSWEFPSGEDDEDEDDDSCEQG